MKVTYNLLRVSSCDLLHDHESFIIDAYTFFILNRINRSISSSKPLILFDFIYSYSSTGIWIKNPSYQVFSSRGQALGKIYSPLENLKFNDMNTLQIKIRSTENFHMRLMLGRP